MKHINVGLFVPHNGCPHQCTFCNQRAISGQSKQVTPADVDSAVEIAMKNPNSVGGEIAFFGGSFTAIDRKTMTELLSAAYKYVENGSFKGIRCSTRPDAIDDEICRTLKAYGVTAVELGAQSMSDEVLRLNQRGHTAQDIVNASEMLKGYGFELGLQMMTGLYGSTDTDSIDTARRIIKLKPETVRIYPTVVIKNTELARLYESGEYTPQTVDEAAELCAELLLMFEEAGIKVIRTGLHSGGDVSDYIAGAYHPAFKEICEGKIYIKKALDFIRQNNIETGDICIYVSPDAVSKMTGQKRTNLTRLGELGYNARVMPDPEIKRYCVYIEKIRRNEEL